MTPRSNRISASSSAGKVKYLCVDLAENDIEEAGDHVRTGLCSPVVVALDDVVLVEQDFGRDRALEHDVPLRGGEETRRGLVAGAVQSLERSVLDGVRKRWWDVP